MYFICIMLLALNPKVSPTLSELKTQLNYAIEESNKQQQKISYLNAEIAKQELALIQKQLTKARQRLAKKQVAPRSKELDYLHAQREVLSQIMQKVPAYEKQAEQLHEELLRFITELDNAQLLHKAE